MSANNRQWTEWNVLFVSIICIIQSDKGCAMGNKTGCRLKYDYLLFHRCCFPSYFARFKMKTLKVSLVMVMQEMEPAQKQLEKKLKRAWS